MRGDKARWRRRWPAVGLVALLLAALAGSRTITRGATPDPAAVPQHRYGSIPLDPATYREHLRWEDASLAGELPPAYDARSYGWVTPAKDQGDCGSCWAFASVGAMESHLAQFHAAPILDLSEQQLVSCDTDQNGCDGGGPAAILFWDGQGPIYESCFPYEENDTEPCSGADPCDQLGYRVVDWDTVPTGIDQIKLSLYNRGPTWFSFAVYSDFPGYWDCFLLCDDVYVNEADSTLEGWHAVLLIGWSDSRGAWLLKNSWGAGGPLGDGTFWMSYDGHAHDLGVEVVNFDVVPAADLPWRFVWQRWATQQGGWQDGMKWRAGDYDGDGKTDLAALFQEGGRISIDVHASTGSAFELERWATRQGTWSDAMQWYAGDYNADGRTDLAALFKDSGKISIDVYSSTGTSFELERWATQQGGWLETMLWFVGDYDGDGTDDLAGAFPDGGQISIDVHASTGSAFELERWATQQGGWQEGMKWRSGDYNADGRTDFAALFQESGNISIDVHASTGTAFELERWATQQGAWSDSTRWFAGDFDADGLADLAAAFSDGGRISIDVHASTGTAFELERWATRQGSWLDGMNWFTVDSNGDLADDLAVAFDDHGKISVDVHASTGTAFDLERWATWRGAWSESMVWLAGDYDGYGRDDLAAAFPDGGQISIDVYAARGPGKVFLPLVMSDY